MDFRASSDASGKAITSDVDGTTPNWPQRIQMPHRPGEEVLPFNCQEQP